MPDLIGKRSANTTHFSQFGIELQSEYLSMHSSVQRPLTNHGTRRRREITDIPQACCSSDATSQDLGRIRRQRCTKTSSCITFITSLVLTAAAATMRNTKTSSHIIFAASLVPTTALAALLRGWHFPSSQSARLAAGSVSRPRAFVFKKKKKKSSAQFDIS